MKKAIILLGFFSILLTSATSLAQNELEIHCINIGQGDCTLIISPTGRTMMIDAGPPFNASEEHLYLYLNELAIDTIDYFIPTHYHEDHLGGLEALIDSGYVIDSVFDRGFYYCNNTYYYYDTTFERNTLVKDQIFDLGGGVTVKIIALNGNGVIDTPYVAGDCGSGSNSENNFSVAIIIDYKHFQFFVGGDLPGASTKSDDESKSYKNIESSIIDNLVSVDVYQVDHHGSKFSSNTEFLASLDPAVSVISAGNNGDNLPDSTILLRLNSISTVYQTQNDNGNDIDGDIVIKTPGYDYYTVNSDYYILPPLNDSVYYHAFQNFDDDVDRVKTYSNFFGGDYDIEPPEEIAQQFTIFRDTLVTRSNYGRSLGIAYGPLDSWSMYVESFNSKKSYPSAFLNLTNLFPDYTDTLFQNRAIDSIVFYCLLKAVEDLTLKLELKDTTYTASTYAFDITPSSGWQRIAVALEQFTGSFDASIAKYFGLTFADSTVNQNEAGTLYVDDFYLVENGYTKPALASITDTLEYINKVNFRHFWTAVEPVSKFALDRNLFEDLISVDGIGFQLSSYVIAHKQGWVNAAAVEARVEHILDYLLHHCPRTDDTAQAKLNPMAYASVDGNWAHFLDYQTLSRKDTDIEYSIFTNALLLSGVVVCHQYFNSNDNIQNWADSLYRMTNWNLLYMPDSQLMHYAWSPESGLSDAHSNWFTEELDLAFLLAISSPDTSHRIPYNPFHSSYYQKPICTTLSGNNYVYSAPGANFTYYFMQMYSRFDQKNPAIYRIENTRNALLADLEYCQNEYATLGYDPRIFGTTACEGPDSAGGPEDNYHAYGYSCRNDTDNEPNGTIAVYGSGAATLFIPDEAIACLRYYYNELDSIFKNKYDYNFWSPIFGFPDAFHLAPNQCHDTLVNSLPFNGPWISVPRFSIDIGPMLMNIDSYIAENNSEKSIRDYFSGHPNIVPNLWEFNPVDVNDIIEGRLALIPELALHHNYPNPFNPVTTIHYDLPKKMHVDLTIYNILGQKVKTLINEFQGVGHKTVTWDGTNDLGKLVSTGIYFYSIQANNQRETRKMLLLK